MSTGVPPSFRMRRSAGASPPATEHLEALGEHLLEVLDGTTLEQHVPVGPRRLDLLGGGLGPAHQLGRGTVELALPRVGELGVVSEGNREQVAGRAPVLGVLPLDRRGVPFGLVADAAQSAAAQGTLAHGTPSSRAWCRSGLDVRRPGEYPRTGESQGL